MKTPYRIQFEDRNTYLYASVSGEQDSLEISIAFWTDIIAHMRNNNFSRALVTEDFKDAVSTLDMYMLVDELQKRGITDLKIAFCDKEISHHDLNKFAETVAVNRGIFAKVFNDEKEAEQWLITD